MGLSSHPKVIEAAHRKPIRSHGYGMSGVRFICGTQDIHKELEQKIAQFWEPNTILYAAAFDANGGQCLNLCSTSRITIISDALNHASIIDGVRLCVKRNVTDTKHNNMDDLEQS